MITDKTLNELGPQELFSVMLHEIGHKNQKVERKSRHTWQAFARTAPWLLGAIFRKKIQNNLHNKLY